MPKTLCLYAFNERDALFNTNLMYFIRNGVFASPDVVFCVIISGVSKINIDKQENITVLKRANEKGDFGAWGYGLEKMGTNFDYFIFLNDTCRGPYIPNWSPRSEWVKYFTMKLDDKCKLIGPTKNDLYGEHLQSYAFAMNKETMQMLFDEKIFHPTLNYKTQKMEFIVQHEVGMSKLLLSKGFQVGEFFNGFGRSPYFRDVLFSPFEVMFVKTNFFKRFDQRQIAIGGGEPIPNQVQRQAGGGGNIKVVARSVLRK